MHAMIFDRHGNPEVMHRSGVPIPEPQDGEILIRVTSPPSFNSFSVDTFDLYQTSPENSPTYSLAGIRCPAMRCFSVAPSRNSVAIKA